MKKVPETAYDFWCLMFEKEEHCIGEKGTYGCEWFKEKCYAKNDFTYMNTFWCMIFPENECKN